MPFAKVEPLELLAWIAGIGTLACLFPGIVLFVWGALMEGGILRHVRGMRVGGPQPQAAGGGDDGFTGPIKEILKKAWKVLFTQRKPRPRPGQRLMAAGILLVALAVGFLAFVGLVVAAVVAEAAGDGGTTSTPTGGADTGSR